MMFLLGKKKKEKKENVLMRPCSVVNDGLVMARKTAVHQHI